MQISAITILATGFTCIAESKKSNLQYFSHAHFVSRQKMEWQSSYSAFWCSNFYRATSADSLALSIPHHTPSAFRWFTQPLKGGSWQISNQRLLEIRQFWECIWALRFCVNTCGSHLIIWRDNVLIESNNAVCHIECKFCRVFHLEVSCNWPLVSLVNYLKHF